MLTSEHPEPRHVLSENSLLTTPKSPFTERIAAIDLRIGLLLLGEEGRKLLTEYIAQESSSEQHFRRG